MITSSSINLVSSKSMSMEVLLPTVAMAGSGLLKVKMASSITGLGLRGIKCIWRTSMVRAAIISFVDVANLIQAMEKPTS